MAMMDWQAFQGKKICVAVSGGADSVALLHFLKAQAAKGGFSLVAVHCEHGIRGEESLRDKAFVEGLCREWDIPLFLYSADCIALAKAQKQSLETAARNFRRGCFKELLSTGQADYIATAHHLDDLAETVLFRLARGTSASGSVGIRAFEGSYLRPFLEWSKGDILAYAEEKGLRYCVDSTNLQTDATRNKLRLEVMPRLEEAVDGAAANIARFARLAAEDDEYLYRLAQRLLSKNGEERTVAFCEEKPLFTRACLLALKGLGLEKDYTSAHLSALFALQGAERGAWLTMPKNIRAEKRETGLTFFLFQEEAISPKGEEKPYSRAGFDGGRYEVKVDICEKTEGNFGEVLRLDEGKLPQTAVFRFRKEGDFIDRFGGGRKSLKKFFNEEKIPVKEREYLPLIAKDSEGGEVYAVCGVEISGKVKVDESAENAVYISIRRKEK